MSETATDFFAEGAHAAAEGMDRSDCPWSPSSSEGLAWCRGWAETVWRSRVESGEASHDTARMKAEANASVADQPEYRPDPTAILVGEPEYVVVIRDGLGRVIKAVEKVAVAFNGLTASFTYYDEAITYGIFTNEPHGITFDEAKPTLNRRRHGRMASCPRHGDTRGGLCRKCARGH